MKIRIYNEDKEIEGTIEKGFVKPTGTSAHIPFGKKHLGKEVSVVIPSEASYCWLLLDQNKTKLVNTARTILREKGGRLEHHYLECLEDLTRTTFKLQSLIKIVNILEEANVEKELVKKIKKLYSL